MADPASWMVVEPGWAVVSSDGSEVGKVNEVLGDPEADIFDGLASGAGTVLDRPRYVPSEQVGAIEEGTVHLTIDADAYGRLGPYRAPRAGERFRAP
jgi:Uncharacterized protein conserved in bacteria (DUF2171)